jgi:transketolase
VDRDGPTALILTRQDLVTLAGTSEGKVAQGAYVLVDADGPPQLILIGTGSEVGVCVRAAETLAADAIATRVVSMPSWELFEAQSEAYRRSVLPSDVPRLSVEAAASLGWERYANASVAIDRFGASSPGAVALENLGFTPDNVVARARDLLRGGAGI